MFSTFMAKTRVMSNSKIWNTMTLQKGIKTPQNSNISPITLHWEISFDKKRVMLIVRKFIRTYSKQQIINKYQLWTVFVFLSPESSVIKIQKGQDWKTGKVEDDINKRKIKYFCVFSACLKIYWNILLLCGITCMFYLLKEKLWSK